MVSQQTRDQHRRYDPVRQHGGVDANGMPDHIAPSIGHMRMNTLRLDVLGSPQIALADRPIVLRTRKTLALLVYLAVEGGQHPRELLADLFWPEAEVEDARASLRTTLSYVRQPLGPDADAILLATRESVGLIPSSPLDFDVRGLAEAQQLIRQTPGNGSTSPEGVRRQIEMAVDRYRGPFLAGVSVPDAPDFEGWLEGQRTHWRGVQEELLERLARWQIFDGDSGAAVTTFERWTAVNPDEETAWKSLIELHLRTADSAAARRAWKTYRE
ncbi:MAG TPA: BTAD domain-containing putative transcriptional regulator, partial [Chloroflexota bacterium]